MSISSIVVRGFGSFGNGLLAILGFGVPVPVGPGICGDGASFSQSGCSGAVPIRAVNSTIPLLASVAVCSQGAGDGDIVPLSYEKGLYI
jgi:hypothetical protein